MGSDVLEACHPAVREWFRTAFPSPTPAQVQAWPVIKGGERMWVDERAGLPCHVCGTRVESGWHPDEVRKSWYCSTCQGVTSVPRPAPVPAMHVRHRDRL